MALNVIVSNRCALSSSVKVPTIFRKILSSHYNKNCRKQTNILFWNHKSLLSSGVYMLVHNIQPVFSFFCIVFCGWGLFFLFFSQQYIAGVILIALAIQWYHGLMRCVLRRQLLSRGGQSQFSPFRYFPKFSSLSNDWLPLNITFIFDRCHHSSVAMRHTKYENVQRTHEVFFCKSNSLNGEMNELSFSTSTSGPGAWCLYLDRVYWTVTRWFLHWPHFCLVLVFRKQKTRKKLCSILWVTFTFKRFHDNRASLTPGQI